MIEYTRLSVMLNQVLSSKNMNSIIIEIDLNIQLQPFNCFVLFWCNFTETALYHAPLRLGHGGHHFLTVLLFRTLILRCEINVFTLF